MAASVDLRPSLDTSLGTSAMYLKVGEKKVEKHSVETSLPAAVLSKNDACLFLLGGNEKS